MMDEKLEDFDSERVKNFEKYLVSSVSKFLTYLGSKDSVFRHQHVRKVS